VSISGVTITGGVVRSSPESIPFFGVAGLWAAGGGIEIPPDASLASGATVTISDSLITDNHADPSATIPSGVPCPGFSDGQCPFAAAVGGGIDSWGALTLRNTTVSHNTVGAAAGLPPLASNTDGAGVANAQGSLTLTGSVVTGNHAAAAIPDGRFAEGAGILVGLPFLSGGDELTLKNSTVSGNVASLTSNLPSFFDGQLIEGSAFDGGIEVFDGMPTTVENSTISGNSVTADDPRGEAGSGDGAMIVGDSPLTMSNTVISGNVSVSNVATSADNGPFGTAIEADGCGTITGSSITGNVSKIVSPHGTAAVAGGGLAVLIANDDPQLLTVRDTTVSGNVLTALSTTGSASVEGAGIINNSLLELVDDQVSNNTGTATGPAGHAQGGGIWNGVDLSGPPVQLTLRDTRVTGNRLAGSTALSLQGGGLFTTFPVTLTGSLIAGNVPDQCAGCAGGAASMIKGHGPGARGRRSGLNLLRR